MASSPLWLTTDYILQSMYETGLSLGPPQAMQEGNLYIPRTKRLSWARETPTFLEKSEDENN